VGGWWQFGDNGMSACGNSLDYNILSIYFYQNAVRNTPAIKDSAIGNTELSTWNNIQKDRIKRDLK
jgi:hypothetical protein